MKNLLPRGLFRGMSFLCPYKPVCERLHSGKINVQKKRQRPIVARLRLSTTEKGKPKTQS